MLTYRVSWTDRTQGLVHKERLQAMASIGVTAISLLHATQFLISIPDHPVSLKVLSQTFYELRTVKKFL